MIAGVSWAWWVGFHAVVAAVLLADSLLPGHRRESRHAQTFAWLGTAGLGAGCGGICLLDRRGAWAGRRRSSLWPATRSRRRSASTIFLCSWFFSRDSGSAGSASTRRCCGACGARLCCAALFIAAGIALLQRLRVGHLDLRRCFCSMRRGGWCAAARRARRFRSGSCDCSRRRVRCLPVILAVEVTDLLFATDSIPAVLSVTHNPFVAYTSNVAAILGLRSLYFALAAMLDRFRIPALRAWARFWPLRRSRCWLRDGSRCRSRCRWR